MAAHPDEVRARAVRLAVDERRPVKDVAAQLGIPARTVSGWARIEWIRRRGQDWLDEVRPFFDFLVPYGFAVTQVRADEWWEAVVVYRSPRAVVEVIQSIEFNAVALKLHRADLFDLPRRSSDRVRVSGVPGQEGLWAEWLVRPRYGSRRAWTIALKRFAGLDPEHTRRALEFWTGVLREYAGDFLAGDLSTLDSAQRMVRRAVRGAEPTGAPTVTVWAPRKPRPRQEQAVINQVRAVAADAQIVLQRYPVANPLLMRQNMSP